MVVGQLQSQATSSTEQQRSRVRLCYERSERPQPKTEFGDDRAQDVSAEGFGRQRPLLPGAARMRFVTVEKLATRAFWACRARPSRLR